MSVRTLLRHLVISWGRWEPGRTRKERWLSDYREAFSRTMATGSGFIAPHLEPQEWLGTEPQFPLSISLVLGLVVDNTIPLKEST